MSPAFVTATRLTSGSMPRCPGPVCSGPRFSRHKSRRLTMQASGSPMNATVKAPAASRSIVAPLGLYVAISAMNSAMIEKMTVIAGQPIAAAGDAADEAAAKASAPAAAESTTATTAGRSSHAGSRTSLAAKSRTISVTLPTASTIATGSSHHAGSAPPRPIESAQASVAKAAVIRPAKTTRDPKAPTIARRDLPACGGDVCPVDACAAVGCPDDARSVVTVDSALRSVARGWRTTRSPHRAAARRSPASRRL